MPGVTVAADVAAPPERMWQIMCDPHRYPEIVLATDRMVHVPEGEMGVGYVYKEFGGIPPFKSESTWTVTEFDPITRQVHVGKDGTVTMNLDIQIEPTTSGHRLTLGIVLKPRWFLVVPMALLWPLMMRKRAQQVMDGTVANFKRAAESA